MDAKNGFISSKRRRIGGEINRFPFSANRERDEGGKMDETE